MATFKALILSHHKKEDGTYNVKIRVTHNRKVKYIRTSYYLTASDVSKRKRNGKEEIKIKNQSIIDAVDSIIMDYRKKLIPVGSSVDGWDVDRLVKYLANDTASFSLDFIAYGRKYADSIIAKGKESTGRLYHTSLNALVRFLGRERLDILEITTKFLKSFENHLTTEPKQQISHGKLIKTEKKKADRTVLMIMSHMKCIYELAKDEYNDEDNAIINIPYSPFSKYKMVKVKPANHRVLSVEQVQKIIDHPYTGKDTMEDLAKDVFILSFCLMGINTADLYEASDLHGDILTYMRKKTRDRRNDRATIKVRIEPEIMGLLRKYRGNELIFNFAERYKSDKAFNRAINAGLDKVGKAIGVSELTFYYARHSMASICANVLNIEIARVDEMLNHADPRMALARVYIEKDFKPLWDANRRLLDLFKWDGIQKNAQI